MPPAVNLRLKFGKSVRLSVSCLLAILVAAGLGNDRAADAASQAAEVPTEEAAEASPQAVAAEAGQQAGAERQIAPDALRFFENKIRPVLIEKCYECHASSANSVRGGLLVDSRQGLLRGGDSGPAVVPGRPAESLLLDALRHESFEMPPEGPLDDAVIADFASWIEQGAADPRDAQTAAEPSGQAPEWTAGLQAELAAKHWAFQSVERPDVPVVQRRDWVINPIDRFVLANLEARDWAPAPPADPRTLVRRVTFDLTGLPPTPAEIEAYLRDQRPQRYALLVDRLLASPAYGERWARHWLDCVRYADSNGADENHAMPNAWRYRDWVIAAFNQDLPYDAFLTHQLAGDLLPVPEDEVAAGQLLTATGMLVIGPKMLAEQDKAKMRIDIVDEQIDTVTRSVLGLTVACARCHDHKFDPLPTEDYYALAGIFSSTRTMADEAFVSNWLERPLPSAEIDRQIVQHAAKLSKVKAQQTELVEQANQRVMESKQLTELPADVAQHYDTETKSRLEALGKELELLENSKPKHATAMAVEEAKPIDIPVHIRGNHLRTAQQPTPRGAPSCLQLDTRCDAIPADSSGRLQLAQWLTAPAHPLTARVMVNRIWMWHFGEGLVRSPSNFGLRGELPTHPALLDWLAHEWMHSGWSMKDLHRMILTSNTYQMSSSERAYADQDPENRLLWRQFRRRLEIEPLRDTLLTLAGELQRRPPTGTVTADMRHRTVYVNINRAALDEMFSTFDYVDPASHIAQRPVTTVPHQALFMMNHPVVHRAAKHLAAVVVARQADKAAATTAGAVTTAGEGIDWLWQTVYCRPPSALERRHAAEFLSDSLGQANGTGQASGTGQQASASPAAWESLARALLAGNEFTYLD
ncbi:PSD1 and planctomycete cytochrome C domain-containing protein [Planctomycetaceae bacterium SH139]